MNLRDYKLVQPSYIKKKKQKNIMYDIKVKDDKTFFVNLSDNVQILTHNCDGQHISALIINFFYNWFPDIIKTKKLYKLMTPLIVCTYAKNRHYFYTMKEYEEFSKNKQISNLTYLKGLGSLSIEDWEYVMDNKVLFQIYPDRSAKKYLDIAFGISAQKRKKWLEHGS